MAGRVTILYDNMAFEEGMAEDWGFSCLVEAGETRMLFDTGARGDLLLRNMQWLGIDPVSIDAVFISHPHFDHTGGLDDYLRVNPCRVYIPPCCRAPARASEVVRVSSQCRLEGDFFSTGELSGIEQALVVKSGQDNTALVVGCCHPGLEGFLERAGSFGPVRFLVGGLHAFSHFELLKEIATVCPTHCTRYRDEIRSLYPGAFEQGGAGRVLML